MRVLAICAGLALLTGCADGDMCGNRLVSRLPSPDGMLEAVVYERDCGATTALSTHVSIVQPGVFPVGAGNVFVASGGESHAEWRDLEATAVWTGTASLEVSYDGASRVSHEQQYLDGVAIIYRQVSLATGRS